MPSLVLPHVAQPLPFWHCPGWYATEARTKLSEICACDTGNRANRIQISSRSTCLGIEAPPLPPHPLPPPARTYPLQRTFLNLAAPQTLIQTTGFKQELRLPSRVKMLQLELVGSARK